MENTDLQELDVAALQENGGIVSNVPVKKVITWKRVNDDGDEVESKFVVHVVRQSFGFVERLFTTADDKSRSATFISEAIRLGKNGKQRLSYDQAYQLHPTLAQELVRVINEVNGVGTKEGDEGKGQPKKSGMNSSSPESVDEQ